MWCNLLAELQLTDRTMEQYSLDPSHHTAELHIGGFWLIGYKPVSSFGWPVLQLTDKRIPSIYLHP